MDRRQALRAIGSAAAGAVTSPLWVRSLGAVSRQQSHSHAAQTAMAAAKWTPNVLNAHQNDTVVVLTELIIPETDTPGAKGTNVNRFVDNVLGEAKAEDRDRFLKGLSWIDERSRALFGKDLTSATPADQTALLTRLSVQGNPDKEEPIGREFFEVIKGMTIDGYYTTEVGLRKELGDSGQLFQAVSQGCDHPEHQ
jgi:Gluconate 2-dehydrogenase subunit 3